MKAKDIAKILFAVTVFGYVSHKTIVEAYTGPRIGAICCDGWHSNATGRGACSHHGGVDHWIYAERDGIFKPLATPMLVVAYGGGIGAAISGLVALGYHIRENNKQLPPGSGNQASQNTGTVRTHRVCALTGQRGEDSDRRLRRHPGI
jgi:hypothetical protein